MKKLLGLLLALAAVLLLAGCQPTPETEAVVSKNDGALAAALQTTAEPSETEDGADTAEAQTYSYTDSFQNTAGDITYTVNVQDVEIPGTALPVLQVTPHEFTGAEVQTIAQALFGDAKVYEYSTELSKTEIENAILEKRQFISDRDALVAYYGGDEETADRVTEAFESSIANLEDLYEAASDTVELTPCQWTFYPQSHYNDPTWDLETDEDYDALQMIKASVTVDGVPYILSASNRDESDYRIHSLYAYIDDSLMTAAEQYSAEEIDADSVLAEVRDILANLGMGEWEIDSCEVSEFDMEGAAAQVMNVTACPVYNGVKVTHYPQLTNLKSGDEYASNYYYEEIRFTFSGGRLLRFEYTSPLEVVQTVNENVQALSFDKAAAAFRQRMELNDVSAYSLYAEGEGAMEIAFVDVTVDGIEFGLTRTRIQNNDTDFYLLPSYTFTGSAVITYADGTTEQYVTGDGAEEEAVLAVINAVDGSVIDVSKGY